MLTLYGVARSRATRPLWMLHECGAEFAHVPVIQSYRLEDPGAADAPLNTASPAYLAINPLGQVPALDDDGLVLTESLAICLHIARTRGGDLGPRDGREDALAENWALFAATGVEAAAIGILYTFMDKLQDTEEGQAKIAAAVEALQRPLRRLEAHLAGTDWIMGGRFTVADVMVAECLRYGTIHAPLLVSFPAVAAWHTRCRERPAYQKMWAQRLAEPE
ncbi:MAG TPA: glutathione S-transferase family protein [Paracoccaceae bacterium]|nr:glutathione S-transferase family protein [Paracoccaceae bacterium]HMO72535.1 glutathione S-transferase family protein [Paracoccaceae bacterium]